MSSFDWSNGGGICERLSPQRRDPPQGAGDTSVRSQHILHKFRRLADHKNVASTSCTPTPNHAVGEIVSGPVAQVHPAGMEKHEWFSGHLQLALDSIPSRFASRYPGSTKHIDHGGVGRPGKSVG